MGVRSGPRWPVRNGPGPASPSPAFHRPVTRPGRGPPSDPHGFPSAAAAQLLTAVAVSGLCLSLLFFWGSWTYTGPEYVACPFPGLSCTAPLEQVSEPVLSFPDLAILLLSACYPLAAVFDRTTVTRAAGILGAATTAIGSVLVVASPPPQVDVAQGGFVFPIPTLLTGGATVLLALACAVTILALVGPVRWRPRPRTRPPTAEEVLASLDQEPPPPP